MTDMEYESAYETRYVGQLVSELADARTAAAEKYARQGKTLSLTEEKMVAKGWLRQALVDRLSWTCRRSVCRKELPSSAKRHWRLSPKG